MIDSVLIANRGEIAVRVIRTARDLGIRTVAVYSDADRTAPHVTEADEAVSIGPAPASESYLVQGKLIAAAKERGASSIHPGYGFLAERADFAQAVEDAGVLFIGPTSATIRAMGDKTKARQRMHAAGVPIVPGTTKALESPGEAQTRAAEVGFPVVLKAAAGGGGKGMRIVRGPDEVARAFEAAQREALGAFADGSIYVERYLERPRHIEVQLFGDSRGNVIHLGERECSIQRRHQKLVEEAPSAVLSEEERERMGEAAVRAAAAVDYRGAGTVEFLYQDREFFFLEMNTRLQVEHPVTEFVTGIDLVEWQFRIAAGEALPLTQDQIHLRGHAIECRITSESPFDGFLPSTGHITELDVPGGPHVRWDGGVVRGSEVGLFYDPLLGKLITHGTDRAEAIRRMERALSHLKLGGITTSAPLLLRIMKEDDFIRGDLTIQYLEDHPELLNPEVVDDGWLDALAVTAAVLEDRERQVAPTPRIRRNERGLSAWQKGLPS